MKKFDYCNGMIHSVKKGDTLYTLSRQYDIPLALLLRANPYVDIYNMQVGDEICIPFEFATPPAQNQTTPPNTMPPSNNQTNPTPSVTLPSTNQNAPGSSVTPPSMNQTIPMAPSTLPSMNQNTPMPSVTPPSIYPNNSGTSPCANTIYYVVKENDTLFSVLDYFNLELEDLLNCNSMDNLKLLPGSRIQITLSKETENGRR